METSPVFHTQDHALTKGCLTYMKINQSVKNIQKYRRGGFRYITKYLFLYNKKIELKMKYTNIVMWVLLIDDQQDPPLQTILQIGFYRKHPRTPPQYYKMIVGRTPSKTKSEQVRSKRFGRRNMELSYIEVIRDNVLDSYNIRTHSEWKLKSIIGWTHGISKFRSTELSGHNKTTPIKAKRSYANRRGRL